MEIPIEPEERKREVMRFGRKPRKTGEDRIWKLAGEEVQETVIQVSWSGAGESARLQETKAAICSRSKEADDVGVGYGDERRRVATQRLLHSLECACAAGA